MGRNENNILMKKSMDFSVRIVNLYKNLRNAKDEYVLSKQLLRSGTSVGANIWEAEEAISKKDFAAKLYISLKEARETEYWLQLLVKTDYLCEKEFNSINSDCDEIIKILVSIVKTLNSQ